MFLAKPLEPLDETKVMKKMATASGVNFGSWYENITANQAVEQHPRLKFFNEK